MRVKSLITAGLCRALSRAGCNVAQFKSLSITNNSVPTPDGGEIGPVQALACGLDPSADFNPDLSTIGSDNRSELIIRGQA